MCQCCDNSQVDELDLLKAFHGHLGPWVLAGMRMGRYALQRLQADPHFGIETDVWCPGAPPPSCMLDGIQFSTGCTLGKQNIRHHVTSDVTDGIRARFKNRHSGEILTVALRLDAMQRAVDALNAEGDEAGAAIIHGYSDEELLEEIGAE